MFVLTRNGVREIMHGRRENVKVFDYDDLQSVSLSHWGCSDTTIRLPSDRERTETLNGPCRTYRLGIPMKLRELEKLPEDLQLLYLRRLRCAGASADAVGRMLGISSRRLGERWRVRFDRPDPTAWAAFLGQC